VSGARGLFVSFEGVDGSGKSTQARLLAERLRAGGRDVVLTREPGGSPGAEEIRRLVLTGDRARWSPETEILLFTAARRDHLERTIRPALGRGAVVITDRFADSTRLYQGATRGDLRGLVDRLHDLLIGTEPDLTVVLDMDPRQALDRSLRRLGSPGDQDADAMRAIRREAAATAAEFLAGAGEPPVADLDMGVAVREVDEAEDRFEAFGLEFQARIRAGFRRLAEEFPDRIALVDGDRPEAEVADDVARLALPRLSPH
jgi:dTMP kinase